MTALLLFSQPIARVTKRGRVMLVGEATTVHRAKVCLADDYELLVCPPTPKWPARAREWHADLVLFAAAPAECGTAPAAAEFEAPTDGVTLPCFALPETLGELRLLVRSQFEIARVRREAEERVREVEERFRHVADQSPLMFWASQADGRISFLNQRWLEYTGLAALDALGWGWLNALHPEDMPRVQATWQQVLHTRTPLRIEYRLRRHDGAFRWMLDSADPRFLHGEFVGHVGSIVDITDEREEIDQLARERSQMRMALRAGRSGTFEWDIPSGRVRLSPELEALYGLPPHSFEKTYRAWTQLLEPADAARVEREIQRCFEKRIEETSYEFRIKQPHGPPRWLEAKARFLYGRGGAPRRMIGINIDIDARKRAELHGAFVTEVATQSAASGRPEELMRTVTSALGQHLGVARCDILTASEDRASARIEHAWTRAPEAAAQRGPHPLLAFSAPELWEIVTSRPFAVCEVEAEPLARAEARRHPGSPIQAWASAPLTRDGRWIASLVIADEKPRDWQPDELHLLETLLARVWPVIERARSEQAVARAEAKIRESEERQRLALEAAQLGTWDYNLRTDEFRGDARCKQLHGFGSDTELELEAFQAVVHPEDRERFEAALRLARQPEHGGLYQAEYRVGDGRNAPVRWLRASGRVYFDGDEPVRFIGTVLDITDVVKARETLAERRKELEQTVRERTARLQETIAELESFSYSISHDLRAPLRAMHSFAEIIETECGPTMSENGRGYLRRLIRAAERMDRLVHDVLVYSRVSRTELQLEPVDLERLLEGILDTYPMFRAGEADIVISRPLPRPLAHEAALTQCLSNLLGNAVKFVARGLRPRVEVWGEHEGNRVRISVRDNGIGIPAESQGKIFGIFERLSRDYDGTGIGLAVVRKAAERMGGSVTVTSTPGLGSTFTLNLAGAP